MVEGPGWPMRACSARSIRRSLMKIITVAALAGLAAVSLAQTVNPIAPKKGAWSLGFSSSIFKASGSSSQFDFSAIPTYFLSDQFEIGVPFSFSSGDGDTSSSVGIEPRYYFMRPDGHRLFHPFIGGIWSTFRT